MHTFTIDTFGWVRATDEKGGYLKSQSVEAHLLLAILRELQKRNTTHTAEPHGSDPSWDKSLG